MRTHVYILGVPLKCFKRITNKITEAIYTNLQIEQKRRWNPRKITDTHFAFH